MTLTGKLALEKCLECDWASALSVDYLRAMRTVAVGQATFVLRMRYLHRNQPLKRRAAPEEGAGHREERETGDSKPRFSSLLHNPMQNPRSYTPAGSHRGCLTAGRGRQSCRGEGPKTPVSAPARGQGGWVGLP